MFIHFKDLTEHIFVQSVFGDQMIQLDLHLVPTINAVDLILNVRKNEYNTTFNHFYLYSHSIPCEITKRVQ